MADLRDYLRQEYDKQMGEERDDIKLIEEAARKFLRENALRLYRNPRVQLTNTWLAPGVQGLPKGQFVEAKDLAAYFRTYQTEGFAVSQATKNNFQQDQSGTTWIEYYLAVKEK